MSPNKALKNSSKEIKTSKVIDKTKKHTKTWLAVLAANKNPIIEIIDMKSVLK